MTASLGGITDRVIADTPISVLDFETTGLSPGPDRVVEVSVVRIEPGRAPHLAFDTLVDPGRRVAATSIHGITDEDVVGAPVFDEIAGDLVRALSDSVVAAYNVYFDLRFLEFELAGSGLACSPPHFCLMYMRPMLALGDRCPLGRALAEHGITHTGAHTAAGDCLASASLMQQYLGAMEAREIATFGDLAGLRRYKFIRSFRRDPLAASRADHLEPCPGLKSRVWW
ncbi:MAG: 3'-5' exonuclease [Planctomycetota bacterium]|jgi:DNA polymerase-3 subunit epsilon